jgi:hypothetical protein
MDETSQICMILVNVMMETLHEFDVTNITWVIELEE